MKLNKQMKNGIFPSLPNGKKGQKINTGTIEQAILVIVIIIVLFSIYAAMIPEAQTAGNSLNDSNRCNAISCTYNATSDVCQYNTTFAGNSSLACSNPGGTIPLASLFGGAGVVFTILMAVLLIIVIGGLLSKKK